MCVRREEQFRGVVQSGPQEEISGVGPFSHLFLLGARCYRRTYRSGAGIIRQVDTGSMASHATSSVPEANRIGLQRLAA